MSSIDDLAEIVGGLLIIGGSLGAIGVGVWGCIMLFSVSPFWGALLGCALAMIAGGFLMEIT